MNIIILAHSTKNKFEDPLTQTSYDTYEMKLHKNSKGVGTYGVFAEWVSIIGFANYEVFSVKDKKTGKDYAVGEGERKLFLSPRPAYDAGNRFSLPDEIDFDLEAWANIANGVRAFYSEAIKENKNPEAEELKNEVYSLAAKITNEKLKKDTIANLNSVGDDVERLNKAKEYIQNVVNG